MNSSTILEREIDIKRYLEDYRFFELQDLFDNETKGKTQIEFTYVNGKKIRRFINEYWTSKQRQANPLHEITYRACFKAQLPKFFIELLTEKGDVVYDPFSGRGTTVIEASLLGRKIISNDVNPLSKILSYPRLFIPNITELQKRLSDIPLTKKRAEIDLSMFFHSRTENEIVSLKNYLQQRKQIGKEDELDLWIRMVATNRLTGHSSGFFSVYTLPPNQAVSPVSQRKINEKLNQKPEYRNTKGIILKKTLSLISDIDEHLKKQLAEIGQKAKFLTEDARFTKRIKANSVKLTVTSPPFLNIVQYAEDNWLRCWFNEIDPKDVEKKITTSKNVDDWTSIMAEIFKELYRVTEHGGCVAFEVGEIQNGKIRLDEYIVPLGIDAGFKCEGILINRQRFTKTANIWGIRNNEKGTNTNRVVIFYKY